MARDHVIRIETATNASGDAYIVDCSLPLEDSLDAAEVVWRPRLLGCGLGWHHRMEEEWLADRCGTCFALQQYAAQRVVASTCLAPFGRPYTFLPAFKAARAERLASLPPPRSPVPVVVSPDPLPWSLAT